MLGGFLWACPTCGGRAGTLALLRHRTPRAALTALREAARAAGQGGGGGTPYLGLGSEGESAWVADDARSCPSCARPLPRVAVPAHGIAEALDVCPRCDLVWFERTTMSALPLRPTLPAGPRPYPPRPSLDRSGRRLAWRHDGATGQGRPSAVVLASDDLAREPVEAALPPARRSLRGRWRGRRRASGASSSSSPWARPSGPRPPRSPPTPRGTPRRRSAPPWTAVSATSSEARSRSSSPSP